VALADVAQVLATGGTTIVGVAVGAGLTYWFSALNRRHQEAREDKTRWYEARFKAYANFSEAVLQGFYDTRMSKEEALQRVIRAWSWTRLVSSPEVDQASAMLIGIAATLRDGHNVAEHDLKDAHSLFLARARRDLGHPPYSKEAEAAPGEEDAG
jgi:hypothetical protein